MTIPDKLTWSEESVYDPRVLFNRHQAGLFGEGRRISGVKILSFQE